MFVVSIMGFAKGNYKDLIAGVDSEGRICGNSQDPAMKDFKYFYLIQGLDFIDGASCVRECPRTATDPVECAPSTTQTCTIT